MYTDRPVLRASDVATHTFPLHPKTFPSAENETFAADMSNSQVRVQNLYA